MPGSPASCWTSSGSSAWRPESLFVARAPGVAWLSTGVELRQAGPSQRGVERRQIGFQQSVPAGESRREPALDRRRRGDLRGGRGGIHLAHHAVDRERVVAGALQPDRLRTVSGRLLRSIERRRHLVLERLDRVGYRTRDRKSTRLNSSHRTISYAVFCLKKNNG